MKAIDFANYAPVPTADQIAQFIALGYTRAIVGASYGERATAQLRACADGGMDVEAYLWLESGDGWQTALTRCLASIWGTKVKRVWLDYEEDALTEKRLHE